MANFLDLPIDELKRFDPSGGATVDEICKAYPGVQTIGELNDIYVHDKDFSFHEVFENLLEEFFEAEQIDSLTGDMSNMLGSNDKKDG